MKRISIEAIETENSLRLRVLTPQSLPTSAELDYEERLEGTTVVRVSRVSH
jgi:hypothetical protein